MNSLTLISRLALLSLFAVLTRNAAASVVLYDQPHNGTGTLYQSSWLNDAGSDYDAYVWDNFTLPAAQAITEVRWRGGYLYNAQYGAVTDFTIRFYASTAGINEPDVTHPPLMEFNVVGNAGQTPAGTFGGVAMYDHHYTLSSPFQAAANTKYWIEIYATQPSIPDWSFAAGSGGNGSHFRFLEGSAQYQSVPGDCAFTLYGSDAPTFNITASASPANAGSISGAGAYPSGSNATLVATPNAGYGFVNWTEGATQVSTNASYTFTVTANHTFVAHFTPAYTITTSASPTFGGSTTGGGTFNSGSSVTVSASANAAFQFANWTEFGSIVSTLPTYTFAAGANRTLVANFANTPLSRSFDFDNAPPMTSLPIDLSVPGLTAHLTGGFSIQQVGTVGIAPAGFSGLCVWPNSVFAADLQVDFTAPLSYFSIMYAPQDLNCNDSSTMQVKAYLNGTLVGTNTATVPVPGWWPTGTLTISVPGGFNSVVVHYLSKPPTCQDWGPIFMADNMVVTLLPPAAPCPADATGNGVVNIDDLLMVINNWGATSGPADITGNGVVNIDDLLAVINAWGACP